jgi:glycosyltransferase involved in cell wall biosynthesis
MFLCFSSRWEGFLNVLIEAMACGVPVISTDCPSGPNEIIENGKNGFLVPVCDEFALANAIFNVLKLEGKKKELLLEYSYETAKNFSLDVIINQYENLF